MSYTAQTDLKRDIMARKNRTLADFLAGSRHCLAGAALVYSERILFKNRRAFSSRGDRRQWRRSAYFL